MIILDTNVVSEMMRPPPEQAVRVYEWLKNIPRRESYTTAITVGEILSGIEGLPRGRRRDDLAAAAARMIDVVFDGRILQYDLPAARGFAAAVTSRRMAGKRADASDLQIAGIALAHGMAIATRNIRDFEDSGVVVVNPWTA